MPAKARKHRADQPGTPPASAGVNLQADAADPALQLLPLEALYLHGINIRREPPDMEIAALAETIAVLGLMQNLIGLLDSTRAPPAQAGAGVGIVAGGRRLRALQMLAAQGRWTGPVPVRVTTDAATATEWAGAENAARKDPHMADEVRSYRDLRALGKSPDQIARSLARSLRGVNQRLKLADLPDPVLDAFRAGHLGFDQAAALTMATGTLGAEVTAAVLADPRRWYPDTIRRALTPDSVPATDRRAVHVTLAAYAAAGGAVTTDLFAEGAWLHDATLLDRLFAEKAAAETEALRIAGGWDWAEFAPHEQQNAAIGLIALRQQDRDLPEGDAARLKDLWDQGRTRALTDAEDAEAEALDARRRVWSDDDRSTGGLITFVSHKGTLETFGAFRRAAPPAEAGAGAGADDDSVTRNPGLRRGQPAAPPESLRRDMAAIRLLALQQAVRPDRDLLLDLLAWQLTADLYAWHTPLGLSATPPSTTPEKPDGLTLPERLIPPGRHGSAAFNAEDFAIFRALPADDRDRALCAGLARLLRGEPAEFATALAATHPPQVRRLWTPTAAGYLGRLPAPALDVLWTDLVPDDLGPHAAFRSLKKGPKAQKLDALFNDLSVREALGLSRDHNARIDAWLPDELRFAPPNLPGAAPADAGGDPDPGLRRDAPEEGDTSHEDHPERDDDLDTPDPDMDDCSDIDEEP